MLMDANISATRTKYPNLIRYPSDPYLSIRRSNEKSLGGYHLAEARICRTF
jgi:hypothetical protein